MTAWLQIRQQVYIFLGLGLIGIVVVVGIVPQQKAYTQDDFATPEGKLKALNDCMISLKAQNPRPGVLADCDKWIPLVPAMITIGTIENTTEINQKVDEYLTLRVLKVDLKVLEQAKITRQEIDAAPVVNNTEDLMIYDEYAREGIMNQLKQECGANNISGGPLTYGGVINRENMTQTQKDCVNKLLLE